MKQLVSPFYSSAIPFETKNSIYRWTKLRYYQLMRALGNGDALLNSFDDYRCIFVHIPKTGGISIKRSLFSRSSMPHLSAYDYKVIFGENTYQKYLTFSFVRNPWDKLLSAYLYLKSEKCTGRDKQWANYNLSGFNEFESFVKHWVNYDNIYKCVHFIPQHWFICNANLAQEVNFIGSFEELEKDFKYIQKKLGLHYNLRHLNKGNRPRDYKDYYTKETREIVAQVYRNDIEVFDYSFDQC
jgi:hypothetical protein